MRIFYLLLLIIAFSACKKKEPGQPVSAPSLGYDYFPLRTLDFRVYEVDSIIYNDFTQTIDTFHYEIKEKVDINFTDGEGNSAFKIVRFIKYTDTTDYVAVDNWSANFTANTCERVEENIRYVRLNLPPGNGKEWDGNAKNSLDPWMYKYKDIHTAKAFGTYSFDSTITIIQHDDENKILTQRIYAEEQYAKHIGLYYRKHTNLKKTYDSQSGTYKATSGFDVEMRLKSHYVQ